MSQMNDRRSTKITVDSHLPFWQGVYRLPTPTNAFDGPAQTLNNNDLIHNQHNGEPECKGPVKLTV